MSGLIANMIAGGVKKVADVRLNDMEEKEKFDFQQALIDAEYEKNILLKKQGIQLEEESAQRRRDQLAKIGKDAELPEDTAGGYETEEMKIERQRKSNEAKSKAYEDAGEFEAANIYQSRNAAIDKSAAGMMKLDLERDKFKGQQEIAQAKLDLQAQIAAANNERDRARFQAELAKLEAAKVSKPTNEDDNYASYVEQMKSQGKKPLARYQFDNWMKAKQAETKGDLGTQTVTSYDENNNEVKTTTKVKPQATPQKALKPWERKY